MHIINSPSIPFWGHIPEAVHPGTLIQIDGHIPHHCSKFEINLYGGNEIGHHAEKHSNIALQIRPKIHGKKVICNSRQFGSWGHKEKHRNFVHLCHGSTFNMQIIIEHSDYRVLVNGQNVCMYHHRMPFHEVRILNIEGHVEVHRIEYKHNSYNGMPSAPIYPSAPAYIPPVSYPHSGSVYPQTYPQTNVYPAPQPVYVQPPIMSPAYVPSTVVIEDHHHGHHGHHGIGHHIADAIFGDHHHGHHGHHGHHDSHHHGHHGHHW